MNQLLLEQAAEMDKNGNVNTLVTHFTPHSKLIKSKSYQYNPSKLYPLTVQIPLHNNHNCFDCYPQKSSYLPHNYCNSHAFPLPPSSPALIPIRIEYITPSTIRDSLNDLSFVITSFKRLIE